MAVATVVARDKVLRKQVVAYASSNCFFTAVLVHRSSDMPVFEGLPCSFFKLANAMHA